MFGFDGNFLRGIALKGNPYSLAFTESGDLLFRVSLDLLNSRIAHFTENGQFVTCIGDEDVKDPLYVSVISDGKFIINQNTKHVISDKRIKVLTTDGKNSPRSFKAPDCDETHVCVVYHQEKFFASFSSACRVVVFNEAGEYIHDIGSEGSGEGQFSNPTGLAIDKFSRLIVCDAGNKRLQLFTLEGKYITQIAGRFFKGGRPRYAVIYNTGYLFVTDSYRDCVYVFH
ncbi:unnamed protein product [Porites lobata]|uniref:Uncharacterized protein n=1 Tax=Porites lobata TaxID=104759 RepID=A0ABN8PVZ1_9CNID|nr:unnamed protein product [Porites lobata]